MAQLYALPYSILFVQLTGISKNEVDSILLDPRIDKQSWL
jgi:hypothetical protein